MKRSAILRKTPLKRKAPSPSKRTTPPKSKPKTDAGFSDSVKAATRRIQANRCALCNGPLEHFHHRKLRRHRDHTLSNCLGLCTHHHHLIHNDSISWAYRHGVMLRSFHEPERVPVFDSCTSHCPLDHVAALDDGETDRAS